MNLRQRPEALNFEEVILPHMDAAYNLARWLTRNDADAADVVQESYLRALKFAKSFHGSEGRPWLLTIVRNTCYTWLKRNRSAELVGLDEAADLAEIDSPDPETLSLRRAQERLIRGALERLPVEFREVMIMREVEELSYKEIAAVIGIPVGTVMSRLARARKKLQTELGPHQPSNSARLNRFVARPAFNQTRCLT